MFFETQCSYFWRFVGLHDLRIGLRVKNCLIGATLAAFSTRFNVKLFVKNTNSPREKKMQTIRL